MVEKFKYLDMLSRVERMTHLYFQISVNTSNRTVDFKKRVAAEIFTRTCTQLGTTLKTLPHSSHWTPTLNLDLWDYSSTCTLVRSFIENYYSFWFYCIQDISEEELNLRFLLWSLVSEIQRMKIIKLNHDNNLQSIQSSPNYPQFLELEAMIATKKAEIETNPIFQDLGSKIKSDLWNGKIDMYLTNTTIATKIGLNPNYHRAMYAYLSSYVHSTSFALSQITGTVAESPIYYHLYETTLQYLFSYLLFFVKDFTSLFPDQIEYLPFHFDIEYNFWKMTTNRT